jgi:hypothetical protein
MRKIYNLPLESGQNSTILPVNWGSTFHFRNKDKAKRANTKLAKYYTERLEFLNFLYADIYSVYRKYWLFLSPFDNNHMRQRCEFIAAHLEHALEYQHEYFNTPTNLSRTVADMASVCDTLHLYACKRKDVPIQHELNYLKTRLQDEYNRRTSLSETTDQPKRAAARKAVG